MAKKNKTAETKNAAPLLETPAADNLAEMLQSGETNHVSELVNPVGELGQREDEITDAPEASASDFSEKNDEKSTVEMPTAPEAETAETQAPEAETQAPEAENPATSPVKVSRRVEGEDKLAVVKDEELSDDLKVYRALLETFVGGSLTKEKIGTSLIVTRKWGAQWEAERIAAALASGNEEAKAEAIARASKNLAALFAYTKVFEHSEHPTRHATWTAAAKRIERLALVAKSKTAWNNVVRGFYVEAFGTKCLAK